MLLRIEDSKKNHSISDIHVNWIRTGNAKIEIVGSWIQNQTMLALVLVAIAYHAFDLAIFTVLYWCVLVLPLVLSILFLSMTYSGTFSIVFWRRV